MEIISYVEPGRYSRTKHVRRLLPRKNSAVAKNTSPLTSLFHAERTQAVAVPLFDRDLVRIEAVQLVRKLVSYLKTGKYIVLALACLYVFSFAVPYLVNMLLPGIQSIRIDVLSDPEQLALETSMRTIALDLPLEDFDADGNITDAGVPVKKAYQLPEPVRFTEYTVKSGDSISVISKRFGLSNISTLIAVNNISNVRRLSAGQKLRIPSIDGLIHTVSAGQSLAGIASKYGTSVEMLLDVNDLATDVIKSGDALFIPGARLDSGTLRDAMGEIFKMPLNVSWRLTSRFGRRADPFTGVASNHTGIDMAASAGSPILASKAGTVAAVGYNNIYGYYVILSHGNGYQSLYAHMQRYIVKTGQSVGQGERIGLVGSTGYSTGPHLHFTVYKNGKLVDPLSVLNK